jgi:hypothetical protein
VSDGDVNDALDAGLTSRVEEGTGVGDRGLMIDVRGNRIQYVL